jgi:hypothetical protein
LLAKSALAIVIIIIIITNAKDSLKLLNLCSSLHILMQKAVILSTFRTVRKFLVENEKDCSVSDQYSLKPAKHWKLMTVIIIIIIITKKTYLKYRRHKNIDIGIIKKQTKSRN